MKKKILKITSLILILVLSFTCLAACGSNDKKDNNTKLNTEIEGYYVDEETGDIIDASTGEVAKDENLTVDKETGNIVDTSTGKTVQTKEETKEVQKEVEKIEKEENKKPNSNSSNKNDSTNKDKTDKTEKDESKIPSTEGTGNTTNQPTSNGNSGTTNNSGTNGGNSNTNTNKQLPTSSKKVSFDKQRLYNHMVSIYEKPVLKLVAKKSLYDYSHEIKGTIPSEIQYIFDWYFGIMDGGPETPLTISIEQEELFYETGRRILNCGLNYSYKTNSDNTKTITTTKSKIDKVSNTAYTNYCEQIDKNNKSIQSNYNELLANYNNNIAYITETCDLVESAVNKANIKGKDEVTAIQNIIKYLCDNCEYWYWGAQQGDSMGEWIKDCLKDKRAVCNGYAKAFYAMCYYAGIDVKYYWGYTNEGVGHAWNSVKINGTNYYFDITWHDILMSGSSPDDTYVWASKTTFDKEHIQKGTTTNFW